MCGIILRTMDKKVRRDILLKCYKVMGIPVLIHGCESWVMRIKDWQQLQSTEINFLRRVKGCALKDRLANT
jgi:hypothetical protein